MSRKFSYDNDEYDYGDDEYEDTRISLKKLRKEPEQVDKKKKWDRESFYDRDHDYDERR